MSEMCWEINPNCLAKKEGAEKQPCPAFEQKKNCFEIDRKPLLTQLSEEKKVMMIKWMQENCPKCAVYGRHPEKVTSLINSFS
jgi:hypothetical protein